jgi:peptide-methionine (S)-S-oxide reductase
MLNKNSMHEIAYFASGCFWCTEAIFQTLEGVEKVVSGYTGGFIKNPAYREVCTGRTGHAEGVAITYDPMVVSYEELLYVFFMSHDPTSLNRQGADVGTQYRSAVFYTNDEQLQTADAVIRLLEDQQIFDQPIVTSLKPFEVFYTAEEEHQNFYQQNQEHPYCQYVIHPKLQTLKTHQKKLQTNE